MSCYFLLFSFFFFPLCGPTNLYWQGFWIWHVGEYTRVLEKIVVFFFIFIFIFISIFIFAFPVLLGIRVIRHKLRGQSPAPAPLGQRSPTDISSATMQFIHRVSVPETKLFPPIWYTSMHQLNLTSLWLLMPGRWGSDGAAQYYTWGSLSCSSLHPILNVPVISRYWIISIFSIFISFSIAPVHFDVVFFAYGSRSGSGSCSWFFGVLPRD